MTSIDVEDDELTNALVLFCDDGDDSRSVRNALYLYDDLKNGAADDDAAARKVLTRLHSREVLTVRAQSR